LTLPSVPAGKHTLSIRMAGYSDYSTMVQLSPGQSALISAALAPVPAPPVPTATTSPGLLPATAAPVIAAALVMIKRYRISGKK
ncbi:MAG: PEGA domain-containing protein, partial [Methanomicrobiales archaeon]|nr:PEGA domain-containing protein [Methanomicrobiales archaeon]